MPENAAAQFATQKTKRSMPWLLLCSMILCVLKVTGVGEMSWWVVAAPMILPWAVIALLFVIAIVFVLAAAIVAFVIALFTPKSRPRPRVVNVEPRDRTLH